MRFGVISDLHIDLYKGGRAEFVDALCEAAQGRGLDALLIPGDVSEDCRDSIDFMHELNRCAGIPALYVPGNHDLWNKRNGFGTQEIMSAFRQDESCLLGKSWACGDISVVGHVGWYDYGYACGELYSREELAGKTLHGATWQDALYVGFGRPDPEVCDDFCGEVSNMLAEAAPRKTILMTHMVSHPFFLVPSYQGAKWGFFNGFLGSPKLHELTRRPCVCAAVSGHVHYRRSFTEKGVLYINACLGYESEWRLFPGADHSIGRQIYEAMAEIEL